MRCLRGRTPAAVHRCRSIRLWAQSKRHQIFAGTVCAWTECCQVRRSTAARPVGGGWATASLALGRGAGHAALPHRPWHGGPRASAPKRTMASATWPGDSRDNGPLATLARHADSHHPNFARPQTLGLVQKHPRTVIWVELGRGRHCGHPNLPAAGAGAPKNAGMPLCLDPRRDLATPPRSSTGGRLHSPGRATLEARGPRHRHGCQTRFSAGLRLCWHGAFVYGRHISSLQFGLRILGHRGKPGLTAQCIHVPVPSRKSRRPLHSPSLFP